MLVWLIETSWMFTACTCHTHERQEEFYQFVVPRKDRALALADNFVDGIASLSTKALYTLNNHVTSPRAFGEVFFAWCDSLFIALRLFQVLHNLLRPRGVLRILLAAACKSSWTTAGINVSKSIAIYLQAFSSNIAGGYWSVIRIQIFG